MYSVVLMMALAGGAEAPDHHNRGGGCYGGGYSSGYGCTGYGSGYGYGCSGYVGSYGCYGGYGGGSGCTGARHKLFGGHRQRGHGCSGYTGYGCYGGGYGVGNGCYGGGYGAGYGCTGVYSGGCYGGTVVPNSPPPVITDKKKMPEEIKKKPIEDEKGEVAAPATVVVNLPASAKLTVDGRPTSSTSAMRTFVSPALLPNHNYSYTLTAEVMQNGTPVRQTQQIAVRAGQETRVDFNFATTTVATGR